MKIAYNLKTDGHVWIVHGQPKKIVEATLRHQSGVDSLEITDDQYRAIIYQAVPANACDVIDLPDDWVSPPYETRDTWRIIDGEVKFC